MKKSLFFFLFILLFITSSFSQGTLRGKVIDAETGEALIGATIVVTNTTKGTITDFDGNYTLTNLDPGLVSITAQYVSYEAQIFPDVEIIDGEVAILNVNLGQALLDIEEVVVTARQRQRTEAALMVMQRKSATVLDGISAQQISRLGDSDAASAIRRVTGVSVEGGKYVYVRGLSDRYTKTTLNGAEIPALDPQKNSVQMDIFPSNIIENMIVSKTFSPDLPANFTGGHVNVVTKDFPERFTLNASASFGWNPQTHLRKDFLSYEGGNKDWLGMDDGSRNLPEPASDLLPPIYTDNELLGEISRSFSKQMDPVPVNSFLDQSYSLSLGGQLPLGGEAALGLVGAFSYQNGLDYYTGGKFGRYTISGEGTSMIGVKLLNDERGDQEVIWSTLGHASLKLNPNHKLGLTFMRNQSGVSSGRYSIGREPDESRNIQEKTLAWIERSIQSFQGSGKHVFNALNTSTLDWMVSYTTSTQKEPDLRFFYNDWIIDPATDDTLFETRANKEPARFFRDMSEDNLDAKLDLTIPFKVGAGSAKVKAGGAYMSRSRTSDENKLNISRQGAVPFNGFAHDYLKDENIVTAGNGWNIIYYQNDDLTNQVNSYEGTEGIMAAYAMVDMPLGKKLRVVTGARYETTDIRVENKVDTATYNPNKFAKGSLENKDLLPALNMTYSLTELMNLRFGLSRTLSRPVFRELAPYAAYDFRAGLRKVGNPRLKRGLIDNYDLRWEWFFAPGEMVSLSGFYKFFKNPIELRDKPEANNPEIHVENIEDARLAGFEAEFRKSLEFIPALRDFTAGANFTYIWSEVKEDTAFLSAARKTVPDYPATREMYGQSPYIVNAYMAYRNDSIGLAANLAFNVSGSKIFLITKGGAPNVYERPYPMLDFNISKALGDHWNVKFSMDNILNSEFRQTYTLEGEDYNFQTYRLGRMFKIGVSYVIN